MAYALPNILWFLAQPSSLIWLMVIVGLALGTFARTSRLGRRLSGTGALLLVVAGLSPLPNWVILPLEQRFPALDAASLPADAFTGIIVLGGAEDGRVSAGRGQLTLHEGGERIAMATVLARRLPNARIVFAGGAGAIVQQVEPGAGSIRDYWIGSGIDPARIVLEDRSLNTFENAMFSARILNPKSGERWLLVTSAYHVPRATALFRRAGFEVTAFPVDYRTRDKGDAIRFFDAIPKGLRRLDDASREWVSLVVHRLTGRIDSLLPGP